MPGNAPLRFASVMMPRPAIEALEGRTLLSGVAAGTIRGLVFNDADDNGRRSRWESAVGGAAVFMDSNADGVADASEVATLTADDGSFEFTGVLPGGHEIRVTPPEDMRVSTQGASRTAILTQRRGDRLDPIGLVGVGTIGGTVMTTRSYPPSPFSVYDKPVRGLVTFLDLNDDGKRQRNEPFARSDAEGRYQIAGVRAGTYAITTLARFPPFSPTKSTWRGEVGPGSWAYVNNVSLDFIPRRLLEGPF